MLLFGRKAGSGTVLTGSGGDELFNVWSGHRPSYRRLARVRPRKRAVKHLALRALPARTAYAVRARRHAFPVGWLRPDAQAAVDDLRRASRVYVPTWGDALRGLFGSRYYELVRTVLDAFAADAGVRLVEPLLDPGVVGALAEHGPRRGFADRGLALETLFGDLLPREIVYRTTKATFNEVSWGPEARRFAESWDGTGVDPELVDVDLLRAEWARPAPDVRALACLQQAWLASQ
jgi:asparagine synthase (glutamine-hydrolysing)